MKVWITSVLVVFGMVELYQWMKDFTLPLPAFILGGVLLAIASNYGKHTSWPFWQPSARSDVNPLQTSSPGGLTQASNRPSLNQSSATPLSKPTRSISFTVRHPAQEQVNNDNL
ncbi:MAG TPA: hypothetical protein V6D11_29940 [Waterburya sp.]|jgi:hypothetical protein